MSVEIKSYIFFEDTSHILWDHWYPCYGLLLTSALGFEARGRSPCLYALFPACNGILRFTSGVAPADLFVPNMVAEPFRSTSLRTSIIIFKIVLPNLTNFQIHGYIGIVFTTLKKVKIGYNIEPHRVNEYFTQS